MPTYSFRDKTTGEITEEFMSISQRETFLKKNKNLEAYIDGAAAFSYSTPGDAYGKRTDGTWKEVLSKIAESHPTSDLAKKVGNNETIKRKKSRELVDKYQRRISR